MGLEYKDNISPRLTEMASKVKDQTPVLRAMGQELKTISQESFDDTNLRAAPWPPKKSGGAATLRKSGKLWLSIQVTSITPNSVTVSSDASYAPVHQLGSRDYSPAASVAKMVKKARDYKVSAGKRRQNIPARPFFPFVGNVMTPIARQRIEGVALIKLKSMLKAQ